MLYLEQFEAVRYYLICFKTFKNISLNLASNV